MVNCASTVDRVLSTQLRSAELDTAGMEGHAVGLTWTVGGTALMNTARLLGWLVDHPTADSTSGDYHWSVHGKAAEHSSLSLSTPR